MKNFQVDFIITTGIGHFKKRMYLPVIPAIGDMLIVPLRGEDYYFKVSHRVFLMNPSYHEPDHGEVHNTASINIMAPWPFGLRTPDLTKAGFEEITEPKWF